jgi:ribosome recycling factor
MSNTDEFVEPTPEQIASFEEKRAKLLEHWTNEIPKLRVELEYNQLLEKIEVSRVNTWMARVRLAEIMAPPPEEPNKESESSKS